MRVLENLEPKDVFHYFEDICSIPHGSGNTAQISRYLADFARERGLAYYQDQVGNIIMIREASAGYENRKPIMLQGHMDMVAVKTPDCTLDMEKEGLLLRTEGDRIFAEETSLGGDDGIAVAYGLALLADDTLSHPRLELVITVDEETGMDGARAIDLSPCRARTLLNLDSEEEGIFLVGCAGGARVNYSFTYLETERQGCLCEITIGGLKGGHSGAEIHKERGNANLLLARLLRTLQTVVPFSLISMEGGLADNAIPRQATACILVPEQECKERLLSCLRQAEADLKQELAEKDPDVTVTIQSGKDDFAKAMDPEQTGKLLAFLVALPNGVQAMSGAMEGLVETSLNCGILHCHEGAFHCGISVRSSLESSKKALIDRLMGLGELAGIATEVRGDYPGWAYRKNSPLREKMTAVYEAMFGQKPKVEAIHAGLECGILMGKIPELDCVSMGPDMKNIHTTEEELSISSTQRVYSFLRKLLEEAE